MSLATLPTARDEAWRYADHAALAALDACEVGSWRDIAVPAGARWCEKLVLEGGAGASLARLRLQLGEGAQAALFALNASAGYGRIEVEVTLAAGAHFEFGGITIGGGSATREIVTRLRHQVAGASSNQVVRAVHWGRATGNFLGRVDVARGAVHTDAAQDFKGLLLERGASANARPELEIFADDVKCAHGAAIGTLDEAARFYMAARGIPPETARALLVQAFLGDAFAALDDEALREELGGRALAALAEARL